MSGLVVSSLVAPLVPACKAERPWKTVLAGLTFQVWLYQTPLKFGPRQASRWRLVDIGVGAVIHGWAPEDFFTHYAGLGNAFGVLVVVLIGIPLYSNAAGILPLVVALHDKGLPIGTLLAFMMAVVALSLPEMILLRLRSASCSPRDDAMTTSPGVPAPSGGPPKEYRITAHARAGGSAAAEAGTTSIDLDTTWGGTPTGLPGPAEMLATAFAACLLKNLARSGDLLGFSYDEAHVEVIARRQDRPPKFTEISYRLKVITDEPERRVALAHRNLRSYGTVYNTLAAVCDVHGEMVPVPTLANPSREVQ